MTDFAVDLFGGPGGWEEGYRIVGGSTPIVGIELDADACRTAKAAGHVRIRGDVSELSPAFFCGAVGVIGSPPCTRFSSAGSGVGRQFVDLLCDAVCRVFAGEDCRAEIVTAIYPTTLAARLAADKRRNPSKRWTPGRLEAAAAADAVATALVLEPARYITEIDPEWVALEQVPAVLPIWQAYALALRARGWSAWVGVLNAADFGVPQTRERAILIASRVRRVAPPRDDPRRGSNRGGSIRGRGSAAVGVDGAGARLGARWSREHPG